jgi:hypothetical protein
LQPALSNDGLAGGEKELTPGEAMNALMRFAIASVLVFSMGTCTLLAQSLADVARETRNAPHARAKKVVTNDEIPSVDTMNTASAPAKDSTGAADDKAKAETKAGTNLKTPESGSAGNAPATKDGDQKKSEAAVNDKYLQQQEKISLLERELKVSEQEYRQKQLAHLADANARVNNQQQYAEAEKLDEDDIAQKKEKLNAERQKLADMQEDARHAGVKLPE